MILTGVGSRSTPEPILQLMEIIPRCLGPDTVVRSGGADGADSAFERGAPLKEIYLPWRNFNDNPSPLYLDRLDQGMVRVAEELVYDLHGNAANLTQGAFKLHTRNVLQVLGADLQTPSDLLICWTPDGAVHHSMVSVKTGGTGTAIKLASYMGIPIYNLKRKKHLQEVEKMIERWC